MANKTKNCPQNIAKTTIEHNEPYLILGWTLVLVEYAIPAVSVVFWGFALPNA
jgi:hypothetical protein